MSATVGFLAAAGVTAAGDGPDAAPSSVTLNNYAGTLVNVQWVAGDTTAATELGTSSAVASEPASVLTTVGAGVTSYESGTEGFIRTTGAGTFWWARHKKDGSTTAWVSSSPQRVTSV